MGLIVLHSDMLRSQMRIYLGCRYAGVPQQLLDVPELRSSPKQMSREAMPQRMRSDSSVQARPLGTASQQEPEPLSGESRAPAVQEHRPRGPAALTPRSSLIQVVSESRKGGLMDRDNSLFAALAEATDGRAVEVKVVQVEGHQLADTHPGRVKQL